MKIRYLPWLATCLITIILAVAWPTRNVAATSLSQIDVDQEADQVFNEGLSLFEAGYLQEALPKFEAAALLYQDTNERFAEATCWLYVGIVKHRLFDYFDALQAYDKSLLIWQQLGHVEGESLTLQAKADLLDELGTIANNLDLYEQALDLYHQALLIRRNIRDQLGEARALNNLATVYNALNEHEQALEYYNLALPILRDINHVFGEATALYGIGGIYTTEARYQDALDKYKEAETIWREIDSLEGQQGLADTLNNIGWIYQVLADYEPALDYTQQALLIWQQLEDVEKIVRVQNNLGAIYHALGQYERALTYFLQALPALEAAQNPYSEAGALINIGVIYFRLDRYKEALEYYQKAFTVAQTIPSEDTEKRSIEVTALNNIGVTYRALADYEQALNSYQQVLPILEEVKDQYTLAATLHNMGQVYRLQAQFDQSQAYYDRALSIREEIGDLVGQVLTLNNLGVLLESQGRWEEAADYYRQSVVAVELVQGEIKVDSLLTSFASEQVDTFERLIQVLQGLNHLPEAFDYVEQARARAFLNQLGNQRIDFRQGVASELIEQEQALRQKIYNLQKALSSARSTSIETYDSEQLDVWSVELENTRNSYTALIEELKRESPEYASLVHVNTLSLEEIQQQVLSAQSTLVEYFVMDEYTAVWVINKDDFKVINLRVGRSDLESQLKFLRELIVARDQEIDHSTNLYEALFAPLEPYIRQENLIIVPHGVFHYLPFAALWDAENQRYLVDEYTITYAPSASVLKFIQDKRNPDEGRLLALGNPDQTLGNATAEVRNIAQLYDAIPLLSSQATESQIYQQASQIDILHLAAHGVYDPFNPLFTRIELAADEEKMYDGNLEVHEVYSMDLTNANLVVLSACETALGERSAGDEIVGLTRAFLYAGAPSVITSLWNVDDESTAYLMTQFYTHYRDGMGVAAALRQAQFDTMVEYPEPYHWAAFTLHGDGGWEDLSAPTVDGSIESLELLSQEAPFRYWLYVTLQQLKIN